MEILQTNWMPQGVDDFEYLSLPQVPQHADWAFWDFMQPMAPPLNQQPLPPPPYPLQQVQPPPLPPPPPVQSPPPEQVQPPPQVQALLSQPPLPQLVQAPTRQRRQTQPRSDVPQQQPKSSSRYLKDIIGNIPCKVCTDKSSGFHFGVLTCEGCKGYFRRYKNNLNKYECTGKDKKNCIINPGNRTGCKYCRLQKCFDTGMHARNIKLGRMPRKMKELVEEEARLRSLQLQEAAPSITNSIASMSVSNSFVQNQNQIQYFQPPEQFSEQQQPHVEFDNVDYKYVPNGMEFGDMMYN